MYIVPLRLLTAFKQKQTCLTVILHDFLAPDVFPSAKQHLLTSPLYVHTCDMTSLRYV